MPSASEGGSSDAGLLVEPHAPIVIGHRGSCHGCPENTLLAMRAAVDAGVHAIEFDVRCSRDGVPVVFHDATVERTTDGSGLVSDLDSRALQRLDAGSGERIPTLGDVLDAFPDTPLLIDVKERVAALPVIRVLADQRAEQRIVVGSFEHATLGPFRAASIRTAASRRETAMSWAMARVGLAPPWGRHVAFSVPEWSGRLHVVDRRFLDGAAKRGIPVHVWTVDEPDTAVRLWSTGVTGIITNRPADMLRALGRVHRRSARGDPPQ